MTRLLVLIFLFRLSLVSAAPQGYGIPGTTQTRSGYDTELGTDAICWVSKGTILGAGNRISFPNPLLNDFGLLDRVVLLSSCPKGNTIFAAAPEEFEKETFLRTQQWYSFSATINLNATSLVENLNVSMVEFLSDEGPRVAAQIMACDLSSAGFCSPFKHEESNARLEAENRTEVVEQGDLHGTTHIHSGYQFVAFPPQLEQLYSANLSIPMIVNPTGNYFLIVALQFFFKDAIGNIIRYDIANALPINQRIVQFVDPPTILYVSEGVHFGVLVANGIVTSIIGVLLWQTIRHKNHQIMKLTQGDFLVVYLVAAMAVTAASSMLDPRSTFDCQFGGPLLLVSAQLMYAVMLGRLWRINSVSKLRCSEINNTYDHCIQSALSLPEASVNSNDLQFAVCLK